MEAIKKIETKLDEVLGKVWRQRCSDETGVSYSTVINVLRGTSKNYKVKLWLVDEIENTKNMFI